MYNEDDLRATLGALEYEAPSPDGVLAGLDRTRQRRVTRRRTAGMVAAAAVVAVVAGGAVMATDWATPTTRAGDSVTSLAGEQLRFPFAVNHVPGYTVAYWMSNVTGFSSARIGLTADMSDSNKYDDAYRLQVFEKGRYDPTEDRTGEPVQVHGKPGFYRGDTRCQCSSDAGVPGVVWEYAPDSWALLQYQKPAISPGSVPPADVREVALRIADAVRFDVSTPVRMPFRLGYLPEGYESMAMSATVNDRAEGLLGTEVTMKGNGRTLSIQGGEMYKRIMPDQPVGEPVVRWTPEIDITTPGGGTRTEESVPVVGILLGEIGVQVSGTGFSVDELKQIARSVTEAPDLHDPDTWFVSDEAFPPR